MKTSTLKNKYTESDLADSFVFRTKLNTKQQAKAKDQLTEVRKKAKEQLSEEQKLYARILQLRFQMEDYVKSSKIDEHLSFSYFLKNYIKLNYKVNKHFANDINIDETELSLILNKRRDPSEKTIIRLELHSNNTIPALSWYKLLEKEKEYELQNDNTLREREEKYVKNRLVFDSKK